MTGYIIYVIFILLEYPTGLVILSGCHFDFSIFNQFSVWHFIFHEIKEPIYIILYSFVILILVNWNVIFFLTSPWVFNLFLIQVEFSNYFFDKNIDMMSLFSILYYILPTSVESLLCNLLFIIYKKCLYIYMKMYILW